MPVTDVRADDYHGVIAEIRYRLDPIDVGYDLRETGEALAMCPTEETVAVSYRDVGRLRVVSGPQRDVVGWIRRRKYRVALIHARIRNLYDQRPPSEGRKLVPVRRLCEDCGAVLPRASA